MWDELKRPATAIAVVLLIISIAAGTLISAYYYNKGKKYTSIIYEVQQIKIFDRNDSGVLPLTLRDRFGSIINGNIYAASISVWNSGNSGINIDDIREPLRLAVKGDSTKIIEFVPVFYTRNNVDRFDINSKTGVIDWKYFDAEEGFKLRVIYVSSSMAHITIVGYVIDTPIIDYNKIQYQKINQDNRWNVILLIVPVLFAISIIMFLISTIMDIISERSERFSEIIIKKLKEVFTYKNYSAIVAGGILAWVFIYFYVGITVASLPKKPF